MCVNQTKAFFYDQSGQGITEYGAVLAFTGMIIALVLMSGHGTLAAAVQNSFSAVSHNLDQLANAS